MAEIVKVYYMSASGERVDFQMDRTILAGMCGTHVERTVRIKSANFHNWTFEVESQEQEQGEIPLRFFRRSAAYQAQLYIGGPIERRKSIVDDMHTVFERDVRANTPGKLFWKDYYISCVIISSSTYPDNKNGVTVNDVEIYSPYPYWTKDVITTFEKGDSPALHAEFLDYDYEFDYDYTPSMETAGTVTNAGTAAAPIIIKFYGYAVNPQISIGGNVYGILGTILDGEVATFDTLAKTVTVKNAKGKVRSVFNDRKKTGKEFDPIPIGESAVLWPGTYKVEVTVMQERSEPGWT